MQIDLFKHKEILKDVTRLLKQVETRKYALNISNEELNEVLKSDKDFLTNINNKLSTGREYKQFYSCSSDNLFELEALGVGLHAKKYTILLDFSDKLDYILHRLTGCPTAIIRNMPNYSYISKNIMTLNYENLRSVKLGEFMCLSSEICAWFEEILDSIVSGDDMHDEEILEAFITLLYQNIINEVNRVKTYVCMYLKSVYAPDFIIRSKALSGMIATTDTKIDTDLVLIDSERDLEVCELKIYSFEKYEYFTGGFANVLNWLH